MTELPSKVIVTIVILVLTISFLTGVYVYGHNGQFLMNKSNQQQDKINNMYEDSALSQYEGRTLTGSQLMKLINDNYDGYLKFSIETRSEELTLPNDTYKDKISCIAIIREKTDATSIYKSTVDYDNITGVIKGLTFKLSNT